MNRPAPAFSILEIVIALALVTLIFLSIGSWSGFSLTKLSSQQAVIEAQSLAEATAPILAVIAKRDWSLFNTNVGSLSFNNNLWGFSGPGSFEQLGKYQRQLQLTSVCRNNNQDVVDCSLGVLDLGTFKYTVTVIWNDWSGSHQIKKESYIANWR